MTERKYIGVSLEDGVATLTINRPEKLNAIDAELLSELNDALAEVAAHADARCLVMTGAGKAFVAGADSLPYGDDTR